MRPIRIALTCSMTTASAGFSTGVASVHKPKDPQLHENRTIWSLGVAKRADTNLRRFSWQHGDAFMCRKCRGDGVVLAVVDLILQPIPCARCGGEGLEP